MKLVMRAKTTRETMMPLMMVDSPGFVSTMSAAARAASVAPSTAIPTSAVLSAGAEKGQQGTSESVQQWF
jgi:hypothetical protein